MQPIARLGATVIGIDATGENIPIAQTHASHDPQIRNRLKYIHCTAEDLIATEAETFDVVVASEVLEHVSDVGQLVSTCVNLVRVRISSFAGKTLCVHLAPEYEFIQSKAHNN